MADQPNSASAILASVLADKARYRQQAAMLPDAEKAATALRVADASTYEALQGAVDKYYRCLGLFYRLLLIIIGYRGQHRDFTAPGWPIAWFGSEPPAIRGSVA